jgi:MMP 1-O-methyltransferase
MDEHLLNLAESTLGFMPVGEGTALFEAGLVGGEVGPLLEIGSYCGKSAVFLGAAARDAGTKLYSIDHHRGSEEHQPGEAYHHPRLVDPRTGRIDTLPEFARTIRRAGLEGFVQGIVGRSHEIANVWRQPLGLVFIDGGHSAEAAHGDLDGWVPHVAAGGLLCIHDVFPDPQQGGRPPYEIYRRAVDSERFVEERAEGSLRILRRRT